jgi:hypothetical protein
VCGVPYKHVQRMVIKQSQGLLKKGCEHSIQWNVCQPAQWFQGEQREGSRLTKYKEDAQRVCGKRSGPSSHGAGWGASLHRLGVVVTAFHSISLRKVFSGYCVLSTLN